MIEPNATVVVHKLRPTVRRFADIEERKLLWLWPGRIPRGKLTVLAGDPGLGKSLVTIAIAAAITDEARWPDCNEYAPSGSVLILSAEDDDADTVRPRLRAAGADLKSVYSMSPTIETREGGRRGLSLDVDADHLRAAIENIPDCRLVVVDPISAFLGGTDSHKNADVRGLLSVLADIAQDFGVALLYVSHLNKGSGGPMARISGSGAFVAAARSALIVARDLEDPDRRLIFMPKSNLAPEVDGVAYRLRTDAELDLPVVEWEKGFVSVDGQALLASEPTAGKEEREEARQWLMSELVAGPVLTTELLKHAKQAGHSWSTVKRAKSDLGIVAKKDGMTRKWRWELIE